MVKGIHKTLYIFLTLFIGLLIVSSFFIRAEYNYVAYGDVPILRAQRLIPFLFLIIVLAILGVLLYKLCLRLNTYSAKIIIPVVLSVSFILQLSIVLLFPRIPTDDSQMVIELALWIQTHNDYSSFQDTGYLHMYPFNFSTVMYLKTLLELFPNLNYVVVFKIFNILFTLVTTLMIYLIYKQLNNKQHNNEYGILIFAATFIPALFTNNLIYNDIISTAFLTSALYFSIRFIKDKEIKHIILAAVLLAIGNYFRSIGIIFLIAIVICILLSIQKIGFKKILLSLFILGILFNSPNWIQAVALKSTGQVTESVNKNSAPVYMWLNMGINLESFGFYDNGESFNIYQNQANRNKAESIKIYKESIEKKLHDYKFTDLAKMYYKKVLWTWTEGTYQLERYGISNSGTSDTGQSLIGGYSYKTFATDLFDGQSNFRSKTLWIVYVMNFIMYLFIFIKLIGSIKNKQFNEVSLVLIILGFVGFYILWEIKSRYIYPIYPILIILSYMGFSSFHKWLISIFPSK